MIPLKHGVIFCHNRCLWGKGIGLQVPDSAGEGKIIQIETIKVKKTTKHADLSKTRLVRQGGEHDNYEEGGNQATEHFSS